MFGRKGQPMEAEVMAATLAMACADTDREAVATLADAVKTEVGHSGIKGVHVNPLAVAILDAVATLRGATSHPLVAKLPQNRQEAFIDAFCAAIQENVITRYGSGPRPYRKLLASAGVSGVEKGDNVLGVLSWAYVNIGHALEAWGRSNEEERYGVGAALNSVIASLLVGSDHARRLVVFPAIVTRAFIQTAASTKTALDAMQSNRVYLV